MLCVVDWGIVMYVWYYFLVILFLFVVEVFLWGCLVGLVGMVLLVFV